MECRNTGPGRSLGITRKLQIARTSTSTMTYPSASTYVCTRTHIHNVRTLYSNTSQAPMMACSRLLKLTVIIFLLIISPSRGNAQEQRPESTSEHCGYSWTKIVIGTAAGAAIGVGAVVAAPVVLSAVGFSASGVVAGSMAATAQSAVGNVAAGSVFATLQSIGAVGGLSMTAAGATTVTTAAAGAATGAVVS